MTDETTPAGRAYSYRMPRSRMIESNVTKAFARRLVAGRQMPAGCIWIPGTYGDRAEFGDLFEPDPHWQPPRLILTKEEAGARQSEEDTGAPAGGGRRWW